jgi:hypothetical protein
MLNIANYLFILSVIMECRYADCRGALITAVKKLNRTCQFVLLSKGDSLFSPGRKTTSTHV